MIMYTTNRKWGEVKKAYNRMENKRQYTKF